MKPSNLLLMLFLYGLLAQAQQKVDSTDIYYKHLRLGEVIVTGLTGDSRLRDMGRNLSIRLIVPII